MNFNQKDLFATEPKLLAVDYECLQDHNLNWVPYEVAVVSESEEIILHSYISDASRAIDVKSFNPMSLAKRGIDRDLIQTGRSQRELMPIFKRIYSGNIILGHNIKNDELKIPGAYDYAKSTICTMERMNNVYPGEIRQFGKQYKCKHTSLEEALLRCDISFPGKPHTAVADARACMRLYKHLDKKLSNYYNKPYINKYGDGGIL